MQEKICYMSAINPYNLSQENLEKFLDVKISTSQIQKIAKKIGKELIEEEEYLIKNPKEYEKSDKKIEKMVISMDGCVINTYNEMET